MKLDKQQINALAFKFRQELIDNKDILLKKEKEQIIKESKSIFDKGMKLLKANSFIDYIQVDIKQGYTSQINKDSKVNTWISSYTLNNICKIDVVIPSLEDIKNEIIITTINTNSIEEIMNNLKNKYK